MLAYIALGTFLATFLGGFIAFRLRDKLHLVLGFSAGAVIGVALFDLLPEAIAFSGGSNISLWIAFGFFFYLIVDRAIFLHSHDHSEGNEGRGVLGASTLSAHSFLDGIAIGISFQISAVVGLILAAAVLTHDFSDGINTVNVILRGGGGWKKAYRWVLVDALAPVAGIILTQFFTISESALGPILAVFTGCFLYLGASDLIPESHHQHPRFITILLTILGASLIFVAVQLA